MREKIIAKRYAEAFLDYARQNIGLKKAIEELMNLKGAFSENQDFQKFLNAMNIGYREKCNVIDTALKDFSDATRVFIKLLLEHGRIKSIIAIADYAKINYSHGEAIEAMLKTSRPLDSKLTQAIKEKMEHKFQKRLVLNIKLDADLLGGAQVTIGNTVIDGTVRRRLDDLKEKLTALKVN